jgi:hypothetical protein
MFDRSALLKIMAKAYCPTQNMLADLFTKVLAKPKHGDFCGRLGLVEVGCESKMYESIQGEC